MSIHTITANKVLLNKIIIHHINVVSEPPGQFSFSLEIFNKNSPKYTPALFYSNIRNIYIKYSQCGHIHCQLYHIFFLFILFLF